MYAIVESPYDNNNIEEKNIEKVLDEELIMKLSKCRGDSLDCYNAWI